MSFFKDLSMSRSYYQHRMIGEYIYGTIKDVIVFLEHYGYEYSDEEKEYFEDVDCDFPWDALKKHKKLKVLDCIWLDTWSGDDFFIGFDLELEKEDSEEAKKLIEKFKEIFPNSEPAFYSFTSVT